MTTGLLPAAGPAALTARPGVAIGDVVGSTIARLLGILGATALIRAPGAPAQTIRVDGWVKPPGYAADRLARARTAG
jgi:hypothetical protein